MYFMLETSHVQHRTPSFLYPCKNFATVLFQLLRYFAGIYPERKECYINVPNVTGYRMRINSAIKQGMLLCRTAAETAKGVELETESFC